MNAKPRLHVFLKSLSDERAAEAARRMPFLKRDFKVTVVCQQEEGEGCFADSGITISRISPAPLPPEDLLNHLESLRDHFRAEVPDAVLAALPGPEAAAFLVAAKAAGVPLIMTELDDQPALLSSLEELTALFFSRMILPATRTVQHALQRDLPALAKNMPRLLPHSADTTYIQLTKQDRHRLRGNLKVDTELKMITMIAPFDRRRDHDTLLDACARLKAQGHEFILLLVGDGPERHRITEKIYALNMQDQVAIMDDPEDRTDILCATDIFALCTHFEGNNIPLQEAMAQGLAIAGTDVEGINDLIRDERSGKLAKEGDADSFAEALVFLLAQEKIRKKLGSVARKTIENRGNLNQFMPPFVKMLKAELKKIAAEKPASSRRKSNKGAQYVDLRKQIRKLALSPAPGFGIAQAADLLDGFPLHAQVDLLEKLCQVPVEAGPLALFVRPLEKVLSDRFYQHLPLIEIRLLEKLAGFYIELNYAEGAQKLIERMEEAVRCDLFRYHFSLRRFAGLRAYVRLSQLYEFLGGGEQRDFYRLEMWEYMKPVEGREDPYFHQQNATFLENLGEIKLAARELQKDSLGTLKLLGPVAVAHPAPERKPAKAAKPKQRALNLVPKRAREERIEKATR